MFYSISGPDNDSYMFSSADHTFEDMVELQVCTSCGYRTNFSYISKSFRVNRRIYDLSYTYDGYCIVSLRFKEACERANFSGLRFIELPSDKEFFYFAPETQVKFDSAKRKTKLENKCPKCGNYESIVGATPVYIIGSFPADICRTNIMFGSGNEKHPKILVKEEVKRTLDKEKITGILYKKINT